MKEEWINDIIESCHDIQPVEVNPFLYSKIKNKLEKGGGAVIVIGRYKANWAIAATLILLINVGGIAVYQNRQAKNHEEIAVRSLSGQMDMGTDYQY